METTLEQKHCVECGKLLGPKSKRDNHTCQRCGSKVNLEVHHKIPVGKIIKDNEIKDSKMALEFSELWMLELGVTYCSSCHCIIDRARYFSSKRNKTWSV